MMGTCVAFARRNREGYTFCSSLTNQTGVLIDAPMWDAYPAITRDEKRFSPLRTMCPELPMLIVEDNKHFVNKGAR
jgi:hypothetical protein